MKAMNMIKDNNGKLNVGTICAVITLLVLVASLTANWMQSGKFRLSEQRIEEQKIALTKEIEDQKLELSKAKDKIDVYMNQLIEVRTTVGELKTNVQDMKTQLNRIESELRRGR